MIDWIGFLNDHNIEWVASGPNVKRGNVNIACPMCADDPSHHMGISIESENWGCWRSANHRGKKPNYLIRKLLGCSAHRANLIVSQYSRVDPDSLDTLADLELAVTGRDSADKGQKPRKLALPDDFRPICKRYKAGGAVTGYWDYLRRRGFTDIAGVIRFYNLMYTPVDEFKSRIIIPLYENSKLVCWLGRAITPTVNAPRYLALQDNLAVKTTKETIYYTPSIKKGGNLLFIVEGPFDAMKLDYYGKRFGVRATCTFSVNLSEEQLHKLVKLIRRFKKTVLLFDEGAIAEIYQVSDYLAPYGVTIGELPEGVKDPGEMTEKDVHTFIQNYL